MGKNLAKLANKNKIKTYNGFLEKKNLNKWLKNMILLPFYYTHFIPSNSFPFDSPTAFTQGSQTGSTDMLTNGVISIKELLTLKSVK